VDIFVQANHIHPFPEGNGRSLQVFMKQLAQEQGVKLDYTKTNANEWNRASAVSGTHGRLFEHQYLIPNPPDWNLSGRFLQK
jgi:cell filamentation protein